MENYHFILTSLLKIRQSELTSDPQYRQNLSKHQFRELQLITELLNFYKTTQRHCKCRPTWTA